MKLRILGTVKSTAVVNQELVDTVGQIRNDLEFRLSSLQKVIDRWQLAQNGKGRNVVINGINLFSRASNRLKLTVEDVANAEANLRTRLIDLEVSDLA